jgi:hypothetical protein
MISADELFQKIIKLSEGASEMADQKIGCVNTWSIEIAKVSAYNDVLRLIIEMKNRVEVKNDV